MPFPRLIFFLLLSFSILAGCKKEESDQTDDFFYLKNDGANLPVWVQGNAASGKIVVILHGGPGGNGLIYDEAIKGFSDPMEDDFLMVYYDQRSGGISSGNFSNDEMTIEQHVEDLHKLIVLLKHQYGADNSFYLMGHSWGGTLGTAFLLTEDYQNDIAGWIEVNGAHNMDIFPEITRRLLETGREMVDRDLEKDQWEKIIDYCQDLDTNNLSTKEKSRLNQLGQRAESLLFKSDILVQSAPEGTGYDVLVDFPFFSGHNPITAYYNNLLTSAVMWDDLLKVNYTEDLHRITVPCLFVWGPFDHIIPIRFGEEAFAKVGTTDKTFVSIERTAHSPMVNRPHSFVSELKTFIREH